jgi:hypothetical protein
MAETLSVREYLALFPFVYRDWQIKGGVLTITDVTFTEDFGHYGRDTYHGWLAINIEGRRIHSSETGLCVYFTLSSGYRPSGAELPRPSICRKGDHVGHLPGYVVVDRGGC